MAARRNRDILEGILMFLTAPLQLLLKTVDSVGSVLGKDFNLQKGFNKSVASLVFDPEETAKDGDKVIEETKTKLAQLKNEAAGFTNALNEMNKPAQKVVSKSADKVVEEAKKEVSILQDFEVQKIGIRKATLDKTLEFQKLENDGLKQGLDLKLQIAQTERELHKQKIADMNEALEATSATIGQVADLFGRESAAGKAAAITQATIDTYLSAQKAYTSTIGIPVVGPVLAPINAGLAIAAGIKNIKAITAVKTPNGGGGGGGNISNSFSGSTAQSPSFNVVGNSGVNQLAQLQQQPVQAYVVSGSVTTAQSLDRNRIENATL